MKLTKLLGLFMALTLVGCSSQGLKVTEVAYLDDGSRVQGVQYGDINALGHDTSIGALYSWDPDGKPRKPIVASGVSNSFINEVSPAAVQATGYYAGQAARDASSINVSAQADSESESESEIDFDQEISDLHKIRAKPDGDHRRHR